MLQRIHLEFISQVSKGKIKKYFLIAPSQASIREVIT